MSVYICRDCVKMVDLDYEDVEDEAIEDTLCMNCYDKLKAGEA